MDESFIRTEISFVSGLDSVTPVPVAAKSAGLDQRFAVVQCTYRPDSDGMFFDEKLWRCLVDFARLFDAGAEISVIAEVGRGEKSLTVFMAEWDKRGDPDPEPPPFIIVRGGGGVELLMATEYWTRVGGPLPYADSYTYSFFSKAEVGDRVVTFLQGADRGHRWELITPVLQGRNEKAPSRSKFAAWFDRLF